MVVFEFTLDDLARTRFAISPMWELVTSLRMLRDPERVAMHLPWVREALPIARGLDLGLALALTPSQGYIPDFLTPPPRTPVASFDDELAEMRATPPAQVRADVASLFGRRRVPERVAALVARPRRELERLADALAEYWHATLEAHWPRVRATLDADLAHRARRLTEGGPAALFADLHPTVRWAAERLEIEQQYTATVPLAGRGLLLVPSAFQWQAPASISNPPWQPTLLYPARGVELLWEPGAPEPGQALAAVLGRTRAQLLATLDAPRSTTELARRLELSAGGISQHLTAMRDAGLVSAVRQGRVVLYMRTPLAERLAAGA
jgi:DNA-binding transcriptional ArsR family regulator